MGGSCSEIDSKFTSGGPTELSFEDEEKSLQYIEISLQEVSREVQRREERRMKPAPASAEEVYAENLTSADNYRVKKVAALLA